jgi:hypothetical protein
MSEEVTKTAEAAPTDATNANPEAEPTVLKNFGDLAESFDKVWPATAEKKEGDDASRKQELITPVSKGAATSEPEAAPPKAPEPPKTEAAPDELPSFLTGDKPKAEEPPQPPPGDPDLPPPTGKESVGMKQLRTAYENLKKQQQAKEAEFKAQLEAATKSPEQSEYAARLEQLEKQNKEYAEAFDRVQLESRPAFQQEFVVKRQQLVSDAHGILKDSNVDPAQWDKAMALTGTARSEALDLIYEYLPRSAQNELGAIQHSVRSLDARRDSVLANHQQVNKQLLEQEQQQRFQAHKEQEKQTLQILDMAETDLIDRMGIEVYKKSDDPNHKKWNESIERMKADAKKILLEVDDPAVMDRAALLAPAAIQFRYLYHTFRDKYLEEKKKNDAIAAAEPSLKTRGDAPPSDGDEKLTFAEAVARQFA